METSTTPRFVASVLATFASKSNPAHRHEVRLGADGNVYCTCPSWRFQKNHPTNRSCKHLVAFKSQTVLSGRTVAVQGLFNEPKAVRAPRASKKPSRTFWEKL
jgi:hypothetical protein